MKKEFTSKLFCKERSVFRNWKEDTNTTIQECLRHDFTYWKVPKFTKDKNEIAALENIIRRYFSQLKEIFLQIVAKGGEPPDINRLSFH